MCRQIGCFADRPVAASHALLEGSNALVRQSEKDRAGKSHPDGWGVAAFADGGLPRIAKSPEPAFEDAGFADLAASTVAPVWIAHVRQASSGSVELANTHPFGDGRWAWAHNGTILPVELLDELEAEHPGLARLPAERTDSERCFRLFLAELGRGLEPVAAMIALVRRIAPRLQSGRTGLNFLASDGRVLLAVRWGRTLWTLRKGRTSYVASEPFDDDAGWREVPERSLVVAGASGLSEIAVEAGR